MNNTPEDISNAAQGHKANLSNPNTSEESKQHSREELKKLGGEDAFYEKNDQPEIPKNPNQVAGGLKAAINNPQTTQEGKEEAREKLDEMK
ncbi:hypothetical protein MBLNU230_g0947t1 [Neophaeotheca triangularis]